MSDPIFQGTLQDMIKGIRSNKKDPSSFISKEIADIKTELRSTDPFLKAEAVRKLTYLQMMGYNVSWAAFAIVEVMSQPRFGHKRIGYLAANQSFDENTEVILLTTNLFKKEFSGTLNSTQYEMGVAINSLANIATKDLARDCISDLVLLMNHTKPYIRKKAVLCMYKLYVKFPQGLRLTFEKLKDRLDDAESSVVSTAVNVICELANKNPRNYLTMAPKFFKLLTTSSNNWMLIKVVKLLGALVSEEPRLARKLLDPLCTIIQSTGAKSLQYECIYTLTEALPYSKREDGSEAKNAPAVIKLCSDHLREFIEDSDQNLKYLGLVGLAQLMKSNPRSVVEHRDLVLQCLNDDDVTIRTKALELLAGIVSRRSLVDLVNHLMKHARLAEGAYRDEVISKILYMCKKEKYSLVGDFAWYTSILLELAVMPGAKHGGEVADQLIEVALRVDTVRPYAVETMLTMLLNDRLVLGHARSTVCEVLKAAAWIVGEYSEILGHISRDRADSLDHTPASRDEADEDEEHVYWIEGATGEDIRSTWRGQHVHLLVMDALLHPRVTFLPVLVQEVYLQAALKVFIRAAGDCDHKDLSDIVGVVRSRLPVFMQHDNLEVQERATTFRHLLAEFDILALNWEDSTEEISRETPGAAAVGTHGNSNGNGLNDQEKQMMDLLEMPMYTQSSVRAVDEYGAKLAMEKHSILRSITAEEFYAVHSKAQRRVPVPSDIDLEQPLDENALDELLGLDIPEDLNLNSLSLVHVPQSFSNAYDSGVSKNLYTQNVDGSRPEEATFTDHAKPSSTSIMGAWDQSNSTVTSGYTTRNSDDVFMLSSNTNTKNSDIIPLSKILGDHFEDFTGPAGRTSRSGKSHKKSKSSSSSKRRSAEVNVVEMVPAGAMDSSSEDEGTYKGTSKSRSKGNSKSQRDSRKKKVVDSDEDELDLGGIDITTPLRKDEVLHVQTHRVVPQQHQQQVHQDRDDAGALSAGIAATWHTTEGEKEHTKEKKHSKKNKDREKEKEKSGEKSKDKDKSSKDKKSKSKDHHPEVSLLALDDSPVLNNHQQPAAVSRQVEENLLGLDFNATATAEPTVNFASSRAAMPTANDRISSLFDTAEASRKQAYADNNNSVAPARSSGEHKLDKHDKASKKKSATSSGNFWIPVYGDDRLDVMYAVSSAADARQLVVQWRVVNNSADEFRVSVGVHLNSPLLSANLSSNGYVALASNLRSGDAHMEMVLGLFNPVEEALAIPAQLTIAIESLMGPEQRTVTAEVHATICSSFSPYKISDEDFAHALSKQQSAKSSSSSSRSSKWGSATAEVSVSCKPKTAFKALSGFLRAYIVESESSKAASMCAKTASGDKVYFLAKVSKSNPSVVQLDIKCAGASQQEADMVVKLVAQALSEISL